MLNLSSDGKSLDKAKPKMGIADVLNQQKVERIFLLCPFVTFVVQ